MNHKHCIELISSLCTPSTVIRTRLMSTLHLVSTVQDQDASGDETTSDHIVVSGKWVNKHLHGRCILMDNRKISIATFGDDIILEIRDRTRYVIRYGEKRPIGYRVLGYTNGNLKYLADYTADFKLRTTM